jgi:hypothetical protein
MHLKSDYSVLNLSSPCTFEISKEGMTTRIFLHCFIKLTNTNGNTDEKITSVYYNDLYRQSFSFVSIGKH